MLQSEIEVAGEVGVSFGSIEIIPLISLFTICSASFFVMKLVIGSPKSSLSVFPNTLRLFTVMPKIV